jgi:hypothetical protein
MVEYLKKIEIEYINKWKEYIKMLRLRPDYTISDICFHGRTWIGAKLSADLREEKIHYQNHTRIINTIENQSLIIESGFWPFDE